MGNLKDFATGTVATPPSPALSGNTLTLQIGEGARMPAVPFWATAHPDYQLPTLDNAEALLVTGKSGDILTFTRAQKGTTAKSIAATWRISNAVFADDIFSGSSVTNETPSGAINGVNLTYGVAGAFAPGSLRVFLNGQRLNPGGSNDYLETAAGTGFVMNYAPATGDVLLVDYFIGNSVIMNGTNVFINQETPAGNVDGTNMAYTTARGYVSGTLQVYVNGLLQAAGTHVVEVSPTAGTFTLTTPPSTGDIVRVSYQYAASTGGNAASVNGVAGTDYGDVNAQLHADYLGWRKFSQALTYVSATSFTIPGDYTAILQKGTKLWLTQTTSKYFYVIGTSFAGGVTTVTITGGTDYTLASAAITAPFFSYEANPSSFPQYFNYNCNWSASSTQPAIGNGVKVGRFTINQKTLVAHVYIAPGSTTTYGTGEYSFGVPVTAANNTTLGHGSAWALDAGVSYYGGVSKIEPNTSNAQCYNSAGAGNSWSNTIPFSWGNGDRLSFTISYEI